MNQLQKLVYDAVVESGRNQADIAFEIGISEKHLSQVINGRCGLKWSLAEAILARVSMQIVVYAVPCD